MQGSALGIGLRKMTPVDHLVAHHMVATEIGVNRPVSRIAPMRRFVPEGDIQVAVLAEVFPLRHPQPFRHQLRRPLHHLGVAHYHGSRAHH